ncbi:HAD superfamily phosphatase (TIGR01668 family) [Sporomusaceae bacterium BoRhaA]|uniref:YqeG family HAD IIIA-type phosphatase n=1 Tax=Pelorhabdus rhamnosifermentans TaxID=2772457 RepID=UPI001C063903|nr:YqeG family HAD IIIA-type phosphatase [Pelorhabdus rhamnosifermentans]MBU2703927.1 HAD superfamily phosphatase (TIGR01668 family) [Pelorhabdus rhamnosifermentans]
MLRLLCPNRSEAVIYDIEPYDLQRENIVGMIVDLDNTIIPWSSLNVPDATMRWIRKLKAAGIQVCLLSNNCGPRVQKIAKILQVPFVSKARKPMIKGFRQAVQMMDLLPQQVAVVGDQIYTDILGGNRIGCYTIWVSPLSTKEFMGTKITRRLERLTVLLLRHKGLFP